MRRTFTLFVIISLLKIHCNAQAFGTSELERMVRMSPQQISNYIKKKGFNFYTTTDMGGAWGLAYVYVNPTQMPSHVVLNPPGYLSYRPTDSGFQKLKTEIQTKYKYYLTTTEVGKQMIYYGSDTRFHIVLDDSQGRKMINVFTGLGDIR